MEIKELLEKVTIDMVLEGFGLVCSLVLITGLFFNEGMGYLAEVIGITLCG